MSFDFTSFSTVFQLYQDYERLMMKACLQWNPVYGEKILPRARLELTSSPALNPLSYQGSWSEQEIHGRAVY